MKEHGEKPAGNPNPAGTTVPNEPAARTARERTRRRMLALAPLVVVAAAPVTNTACDPAPEPYCSETPREMQLESLYAEASSVDEGGQLYVVLALSVSSAYPLGLGQTFSVFGGTLVEGAPVSGGFTLRITPDPGATQIRAVGALTCMGAESTFTVIMDLTAVAEAGAAIPTSVE